MKRIALALVAAAALAGAGMAISSGGAGEKLASQVRVYGGGVYGPCFGGVFCFAAERTFAIDAHVDGQGAGAAYGDWENGVAGQFEYTGQITCAKIVGNRMIIGGFITAANGGANPANVGLAFAQYLRNNGGVDSATPDEVTFAVFNTNDGAPGDFPASFPQTCPSAPFSEDVFPELWTTLRGDIHVQQ